jgi:hypothetical protein
MSLTEEELAPSASPISNSRVGIHVLEPERVHRRWEATHSEIHVRAWDKLAGHAVVERMELWGWGNDINVPAFDLS